MASTNFLFAIGVDEAPQSGASFLVSFLNIGERVANSSKNFLLFGVNVNNYGVAVILVMVSQLKNLETEVYTMNIEGKGYFVEFKVNLLPNNMKMLPYLGERFKNAANIFTTFPSVNTRITKIIFPKNLVYKVILVRKHLYEKKWLVLLKVLLKKIICAGKYKGMHVSSKSDIIY